MASCRDYPCDSASCRDSRQDAKSHGQSLQEAIYQAQQSRSRTVSAETKYDGQSLQEAKISGLVYTLLAGGLDNCKVSTVSQCWRFFQFFYFSDHAFIRIFLEQNIFCIENLQKAILKTTKLLVFYISKLCDCISKCSKQLQFPVRSARVRFICITIEFKCLKMPYFQFLCHRHAKPFSTGPSSKHKCKHSELKRTRYGHGGLSNK